MASQKKYSIELTVVGGDTLVFDSDTAGAVTINSVLLTNRNSTVISYWLAVIPKTIAIADHHYRAYATRILGNKPVNILCQPLQLDNGERVFVKVDTDNVSCNIDLV